MTAKKKNNMIDPIGLEFLLSIYSASVSTASIIIQIFSTTNAEKKHRDELYNLMKQLDRVQLALDDYVDFVKRVQFNGDMSYSNRSLTIKQIAMLLTQSQSLVWEDLINKTDDIRIEISKTISKCRDRLYKDRTRNENIISSKIVDRLERDFDSIMVNMSTATQTEFIEGLRKGIQTLRNLIHEHIS